jgi:hypothetical protein
MSVPFWVSELASAFWTKAGGPEPFPRTLRRAIARALQLTVVLLPKLSITAVRDWLEKNGLACDVSGRDRPLRACLIGRHGHGVALIDGSDEDCEQRFSIAHELAHFLREYWSRRRRIEKRLGPGALHVLDGRRLATPQERLQSLLRDVPLGFHLHLMERDGDGNPVSSSIVQAEEEADRLAYELLAPAEHVLGNDKRKDRQELERTLRDLYGLPGVQAAHYAKRLFPQVRSDPLLLRLRSVRK